MASIILQMSWQAGLRESAGLCFAGIFQQYWKKEPGIKFNLSQKYRIQFRPFYYMGKVLDRRDKILCQDFLQKVVTPNVFNVNIVNNKTSPSTYPLLFNRGVTG